MWWRPGLQGLWVPGVRSPQSAHIGKPVLPGKMEAQAGVLQVAGGRASNHIQVDGSFPKFQVAEPSLEALLGMWCLRAWAGRGGWDKPLPFLLAGPPLHPLTGLST